ncbi:MAG: LamG domain-containing protein [Patescibacteria group bacterium]|nr:LamG domain-containing protein [Patescibacteria group bacterium]
MKKILSKNNPPSLKLRRTKKGSVLVFALIVLSFILVTAFSLAAVSLIERRSSGASVNSSTAFQNSDEGMEEFLQQLYKELDPNDDLAKMGTQLNDIYGSGYVCCDSAGSVGCPSMDPTAPARIGSQDTEFIITAYKEGTGVVSGSGGWEQTIPITSCDEALANVSRFRATGNYNNASRAVFLKLRDSLTRGLVAHWSFEDRANVARITEKSKRDERISYLTQDYSKQDHTLTLCALLSTNAIGIDTDDDGIEDAEIAEFAGCAYNDTGGMNPKRGYYEASMGHTDSPNESDDDEYNAGGSWVKGIVQEDPSTTPPPPGSTTGAMGDDSNSEALFFDGDEYLAAWIDSSCPVDTVNCIEDGDDKLNLVGADGDADGIAVSLWAKLDAVSTAGYLVSKYDSSSSDGYELYLDVSGNVCFRLNNTDDCSNGGEFDNTDWHHIVARWRETDGNMEVFVDGVQINLSQTLINPIGDTEGIMLTIGAQSDPIESYFTGTIDDVRIWNRALTTDEVCRLCWDAGQKAQNNICDPTCDPISP